MANIRFSQSFVDDFKEVGESGRVDIMEDIFLEIKKMETEIVDMPLSEYIENTKDFINVENNGYVYKFKDLMLVAVIEDETVHFIGIISKMTHRNLKTEDDKPSV